MLKPRIALVTHDFGASGGASTMVRFLHQALLDSGRFQPEIVSLALSASDTASVRVRDLRTWNRGPRILESSREGLPYLHAGAWFSEFEFQRYRPRSALTQLLSGYDLVQVVAGTPPWMCAAANVARPKFLWTATTTRADRASRLEHAPFLRRLWLSLMTKMSEAYEKQAFEVADEVFALSDYTLNSIRRLSGRSIGLLGLCGVDTAFFSPRTNVPKRHILCVGRLDDPRKNITCLIDAYARLRQDMPEAPELCLAGPQPPEAIRLRIREMQLERFVRLLGPRQACQLPELYQSAFCFVLSSDEEGLGIVLLEAMSCAVPVVSTACGGPETAIEHGRTGFLTPVRDPAALAHAMRRLVENSDLRQQMGAAARQTCTERFSLPAASKTFIDGYDEALCTETPTCAPFEAPPVPSP